MSSARHDYQQFLYWIHGAEASATEDARRLANLVEANFDRIAASSRAQSRRSIMLAEIAKDSLPSTRSEPPEVANRVLSGTWPWNTLQTLTLGPFRGFRAPETFEFHRRITMFSGPNGSGKTSLCEALELALLGSVDESSAKRINPQRYFTNLHENRFQVPALTARDATGQTSTVMADSEAYRFCYVEKNRIDSFSRIAAKTAGEKKDLIASLFGMEQFHDFVANFNESLDGQLSLCPTKVQDLTARRASLQRDQEVLNGEAQAVQAIVREETIYAQSFTPPLEYAQLVAQIGGDQVPGRLHELNAQLAAPAPIQHHISSAALIAAYQTAENEQIRLDNISQKLAAKSAETSFQNLYSAVLGLQAQMPDNCPACGTLLKGGDVKHDPYTHSRNGLAQLKELVELQAEMGRVRADWERASRGLESLLSNFFQRVGGKLNGLDERPRFLSDPGVNHSKAWWREQRDPSKMRSMMQEIFDLAVECERIDVETSILLANRTTLAQERDRLTQAGQVVAGFNTKRSELAKQIEAARQTIANFEQANAQLMEEVEQESLLIDRDLRIKVAYDDFLRLLRQFRSTLPGAYIAGLNAMVLNIYNEFNRRDLEGDKLADLRLPAEEDDRIELAFCAAPQTRVDALQVLSEGHVRCLGVAILLAKALDVQAPIIIFDDAINAIDTEHREGIRETVFQSERFEKIQLIVTCHSNEFVKDLQNHVDSKDWSAYYFMPHLGDNRLRVKKGSEHTRNYLIKARNSIEIGDLREALAASRRALEMLTDKIWNWLTKNRQGQISLQFAGRGSEPGLRNLCDVLRKRLDDAHTFVHQDKPAVLEGLNTILGVPAPSMVWSYLNKGTHEEANRDDYDQSLVLTIVKSLEDLSRLHLRDMTAEMTALAQAAVNTVADANTEGGAKGNN